MVGGRVVTEYFRLAAGRWWLWALGAIIGIVSGEAGWSFWVMLYLCAVGAFLVTCVETYRLFRK